VLSIATVLFLRHGLDSTMIILIFTLLSFGFIGFLDDLKKIIVSFSGKYSGVRARYIFLMQLLFGFLASLMLYNMAGFNNIYVPIFGNIVLGWLYIPLATFTIASFSNAINISDGLDGLSTGLLTICLFAFLVLAHTVFNINLAIFTGVWIGSLIAYLYFNIYPARVYLGDAGAYGFGLCHHSNLITATDLIKALYASKTFPSRADSYVF
jgi:phospho-N-acetylmuramoyl-pentapeptide-transferase